MYDPTKPWKKQILDIIKVTFETRYARRIDDLIYVKTPYHEYPEYHHPDGVGTKPFYYDLAENPEFVLDAYRMNSNDMLLKRAVPYALTDHLILCRDDSAFICSAMTTLANECAKNSIIISGGETAIHDTARHSEMSIAMIGFVMHSVENMLRKGDALIGVASSGLHANGFTLVRRLFEYTLRKEFVTPTVDYYPHMMKLDSSYHIHAFVHITGGGYARILDAIPCDVNALIRRSYLFLRQPIFHDIRSLGHLSDKEMYQTFNCGIGLIVGVPKAAAEVCKRFIQKKFPCDIIGEVISGRGHVIIESAFSKEEVVYARKENT